VSEPADLSLDEALQFAIGLHQNQQLEGAEQVYRRVLAVAPDHPDALHLLGMVLHQTGRGDEGIASIRRAIELVPDYAGYHNNLGNIHVSRHELPEATAAYERAGALQPGSADLQDDLPESIRWYCKSIELLPEHPDGRKLLGMTYYTMGKVREAAEVFRQWLAEEPGHPMAQHMFAACSGSGAPERASDDYVEYTFDHFADSFETQLNERLDYRAPQLCGQMLARLLPPAAKQFTVLDAGCGTGLCGPLVAPWARVLAGVDLSGGMLKHAQTKGVYGDLYKAELTEFLRESPGQWDVMLSADTLCYFGDLMPLMAAASGSVKPGGLMVFTVEALPDDRPEMFHLEPHGRYAHARAHVEAALAANGFTLVEIGGETLRQEGGKPVTGWLVAARR
jgi:predicted TPR repeat methyltransferase